MPIPGGTVASDNVGVEASTLPSYAAVDGTRSDFSRKVKLSAGMRMSRGRADEASNVEAGSLTFRAEFATTPTRPGPADFVQLIEHARDGSGTCLRFRGRLDTAIDSWSTNAAKLQQDITVVDRLAHLQRHQLRSMLEEEILLRSPSAYYTLSEAAGSTTAGDTSGKSATPLAFTGSGALPIFGTGTAPGIDGLTAVTFSGGQYLLGARATGAAIPTTFSLGAWFSTTTTPASNGPIASFSGWTISVSSSGTLQAAGPFVAGSLTGGPSAVDGHLHFVALSSNGATATLYLDGVAIASTAVTSGFIVPDSSVGGFLLSGTLTVFTGVISHVATYPSALTGTDVAAIYGAANGFTGETTTARAARVAAYAGVAAADTAFSGIHQIGPQAISGQYALDVLQAVAAVEASVLYVAGDGKLTMPASTRRALTSTGTPALTLSLRQVGTPGNTDSDLQIYQQDKRYLENRVTCTRENGAQQIGLDAASITSYDVYPKDIGTLPAYDDNQVANLIGHELRHSKPMDRINSIAFDLLTIANVATVLALLGLEQGDRLQITNMPATAPMATADLIVEGIQEERSSSTWTLTLNTSPAQLYQAFRLGSPAYGVLGVSRLGY